MTGLAVFLGILGYFWTPYSTTAMSAAEKFTAPSMHHIFGTDNFGRDIFSRVMQGLGTTLVISTSVVLFSTVAGVLLGAFTGYFGGILDEILMRITDAVNGFPSILLTLVIISLLGKGRQNVIIALGIVFIPSFVRIVRGEFLRLRDADYIKRARLMGVSRLRILFVHILPNIFSVLLVSVMIGFNNAILAESGMSYLGIGVQAPDASLGMMLSDAQGYLQTAPWYALFPGLAIVWVVLGFSLLGEGIRKWDGSMSTSTAPPASPTAESSALAVRWASPPRSSTPGDPWASASCAATSTSSTATARPGNFRIFPG